MQAPALGTKALLQALGSTAMAGAPHMGLMQAVSEQLPGRLHELRCTADVDAILW